MSEEPSPWRSLATLSTVGLTFVVATAGATVGGYFVDRWLGSTPLFTLIGIGIGAAAGFRELLRALRRAEQQERDGD
jgi:F0F1-type ATP synthase assembly protein I